jgi:hypothetical protein
VLIPRPGRSTKYPDAKIPGLPDSVTKYPDAKIPELPDPVTKYPDAKIPELPDSVTLRRRRTSHFQPGTIEKVWPGASNTGPQRILCSCVTSQLWGRPGSIAHSLSGMFLGACLKAPIDFLCCMTNSGRHQQTANDATRQYSAFIIFWICYEKHDMFLMLCLILMTVIRFVVLPSSAYSQ